MNNRVRRQSAKNLITRGTTPVNPHEVSIADIEAIQDLVMHPVHYFICDVTGLCALECKAIRTIHEEYAKGWRAF